MPFEVLAILFALVLLAVVIIVIVLATRSARSGRPRFPGGPVPWQSPPRSWPQHPGSYPPPTQAGYPPTQPGYPPTQPGYPPTQPGYPPTQQGYPPTQPGYPPTQQGAYPPQQGAYPPQQGAYPPQQGAYPPQQGAYPPPQQPGYPPRTEPAIVAPTSDPVQDLERTDLAATRRMLNRFAWDGVIAPGVHQHLKAVVESRAVLLGEALPSESQVSPVEVDPRQLGLRFEAIEPPVTEPLVEELYTEPGVQEPSVESADAPPPDVGHGVEESAADPEVLGASEPPAPQEAAAPSQSLGQVLGAFMEERHIRWGEIIGGMLIVACSIALVVSLWSQIAGIPLIKFFLFTAVTSAIFGVGLYSAHHWKLPITSNGALIIATLLVPLTVLALAGFSRGTSAGDTLVIVGEVAAFCIFGLLLRSASRFIVPKWPGPLLLGVLGASFTMVLIRRGVNESTPQSLLWLIGSVPIAFQLAAIAWMLLRARHLEELERPQIHAVLVVIGTVCFATLTPLALLIYKCGDVRATIYSLAPLVSLLGSPILATGLLLWRRVKLQELAGLRTAGTAVALLGGLVMVSGVILAWPHPQSLVTVTLINFAVVTAVALVLRLPWVHYAALPFAVVAGQLGWGLWWADIVWGESSSLAVIHTFFDLPGGHALMALSGVIFLASLGLGRLGWKGHGRVYRIAAGIVSLASIAVVSAHGLARDPVGTSGVAWIFAVYGVAAVVVAWRLWRPALWFGSALVLLALVQGFVFDWRTTIDLPHPLPVALLLYTALVAVVHPLLRLGGGKVWRICTDCLWWSTRIGLILSGGVVALLWSRTAIAAREVWPAAHTFPVVANLLVLLLAGLPWLWWRSLSKDGRDVAALTAVACLALVTALGLGRGIGPFWINVSPPGHGAWLIGAYGLVAMLLARRWGSRLAAGAGYLLALLCLLQGFGFEWGRVLGLTAPWTWALLVYATLSGLALLCFSRWTSKGDAPFTQPLEWAALVGAGLATIWLVGRLLVQDITPDYQHSTMWLLLATWREQLLWVYLLWVTAVWGLVAWTWKRRVVLVIFQASLYLTAAVGVLAALLYLPWFARAYYPHLHPWTLQLSATALGLLSVAWMVVRRVRSVVGGGQSLWVNPKLSLEWLMLLGVGLVAWLLVLSAVTPAVVQELWGARTTGWRPMSLGWRGWLLWGVLVLGAGVALWGRVTRARVLAALAVGLLPWVMVAGLAQPARSAGSALRWSLAAYLLVVMALVWGHKRLHAWAKGRGWSVQRHVAQVVRDATVYTLGIWILVLSLLPQLIAMAFPGVLGTVPVTGFFATLPVWLSHLLPLVILVAVLGVRGIQERSFGMHVLATAALALAAAIPHLENVWVAQGTEALRFGATWIRLGQWVVLVGFGAWLAGRLGARWHRRDHQETDIFASWSLPPAVLAVGAHLLVVVPIVVQLVLHPMGLQAQAGPAGGLWGVASTAWVVVLVLAAGRRAPDDEGALLDLGLRTLLAGVLVSLLAALVAAQATSSGWGGVHALVVGLCLVSWLPLVDPYVAARVGDKPVVSMLHRMIRAGLLGVAAAALSLRGVEVDPGRPWWSVGALACFAVLACTQAVLLRRRTPLLLAGLAAGLATTVGWTTLYWSTASPHSSLGGLTSANLIALSAMGLVSVLLLRWMTERGGLKEHVALSLHFVALALMTCAAVVLVALGLAGDLNQQPLAIAPTLLIAGLAGTLVLALGCLWAPRTSLSLPLIFVTGLLLAAGLVDAADLGPRFLIWSLTVLIVGYGVVATLTLAAGSRLQTLVEGLGGSRPSPDTTGSATWVLASTMGLAGLSLVLGIWVRASFGGGSPAVLGGGSLSAGEALFMRLTPALVAGLASLSVCWNLHRMGRPHPKAGLWWQGTALVLLILAAVSVVWSVNEPPRMTWDPLELWAQLLGYWAQLLVVLSVAIVALSVGVPRWLDRGSGFRRAGRPLLFALGGTVVLSALVIIVVQWLYRRAQLPAPLGIATAILVALTLLGLAGLSVYFALRPKRAPYGKGGPWMSTYVYIGEGMVALALLHLRLSLLRGSGQAVVRTWPFVVMGLAFVGVVLGEVFRRRKVTVLATPLERTGIFLPLLPVLSFWALESVAQYSSILLMAGLFYGVLAVARRSFGFGILAAMAANGGLWNILHHTSGVGFINHPQLWLIPLCVSLLAAGHLNRKRLSAVQMTTLRYACLMGVYVSSTVDLFINGVSRSPGLALVLSALSVAGVLTGIATRVRSLLFLGAGFLVLSLLALIWQASTNLGWTWLWYVAGILLGVAIIVFFALFERKRRELTEVVDRLKRWDQ